MDPIQTGIDWPKIELGGVEYTLRVAQGTLVYRLGKRGLDPTGPGAWGNFYRMVEYFCCFAEPRVIDEEKIAEIIFAEGKGKIVDAAVAVAWGKVFPSSQPIKLQEPAGSLEAPKPN